jgi:hypothetical protein
VSDSTLNINLPLIEAAQSQKHITHNQALQVLDVLVQLAVINRITTSPPGTPANGDRYIIASVATGVWAGKETQIASYENGGWVYYIPSEGWFCWDRGANEAVLFNTSWGVFGGGGGGISDGDKGDVVVSGGGTVWVLDSGANIVVNRLGLGGATPDATNRLSINSPAALFNNAGTSFQMTLNKAASSDDALLVFQTGFSTRAIFGTGGSDDFTIKVSPDGSSFFDGLTIIRSTGKVRASLALNLNPAAGDLASPVDGDLWYNSTTGKFRGRQGGTSQDIIGGGGSVLSGTATITITGSEGQFEWHETITAVGVTGSSRVQLWLAPNDDTLENSPEMLDLVLLSGTPGTGTIAVIATFREPTTGPINLIWSAI